MRKWLWMAGCAGAFFCRAAENVALHRPYELSPAPNYAHCTEAGDKTQLTDGTTVKGYFWTQEGTVGWTRAAPALITLDLGQVEPICGLSWSCAAGTAGVTWPECLYVLVSDDRRSWTCLGDLCELGTAERQPPAKGYAQFRFATDKLKGAGRYVCVVAAAQPYCFVDEIEVFKGDASWLADRKPGMTAESPLAFYRQMRVHSGVAARLREDLAAIVAQAERQGAAAVVAALKGRAVELGTKIAGFAEAWPAERETVLPYGELHASILALNAGVLGAAGVSQPLVWQSNRWAPLALTECPPGPASAVRRVSLDLMRGEVRGEAFNVTNPFETPLAFDVRVLGLPDGASVEVREVAVTDTPSRKPVAAALRPLAPNGSGLRALTVPGGCTRQVWLSCRRPSCASGLYRGSIQLTADDPRHARTVELELRVRDLDFPARPSLHVGGWDYVQGKADYYRAPGNLAQNLALMRDLYVDSPWATSAVFPQGAAFDAQGTLTNEAQLDFAAWDAWVSRWAGARNYCVFFSVGESFNGEKRGTPRFAAMVRAWLDAWTRHMAGQGLKPAQLVVLLVDEPHERRQDEVIVAWARAIKAGQSGVTLFEDPTYTEPSKGDPEMFALCDVLCPNTPMLVAQGEPFRTFYGQQRAAGKTLWLYSCSGPAKRLDPVTYHRAQPWLAFQMGAEGSFYWAFGCGGGIGDSWHAYAQAHEEYSPYFVGPESVMEGKHSEAVREGVQDYEYLRMLRDEVARCGKALPRAAWRARAEQLLTEGVSEALRAVTPANMEWDVDKDRSAMDAVRVRVLDLLEEAEKGGGS